MCRGAQVASHTLQESVSNLILAQYAVELCLICTAQAIVPLVCIKLIFAAHCFSHSSGFCDRRAKDMPAAGAAKEDFSCAGSTARISCVRASPFIRASNLGHFLLVTRNSIGTDPVDVNAEATTLGMGASQGRGIAFGGHRVSR